MLAERYLTANYFTCVTFFEREELFQSSVSVMEESVKGEEIICAAKNTTQSKLGLALIAISVVVEF